jgi:hypothetical protein
LPAALYPESQDAADDAVATFHEQQTGVGVVVNKRMPWAMEGYAIACHARLKPIDDFLLRLLDAAQKIFKVLWPEVAVPTSLHKLTTWLATAPGRVEEWHASAARAGAEMALSFVLSWYDEIQLSQLETRRAGATLPAAELRARACAIASYVDTKEFDAMTGPVWKETPAAAVDASPTVGAKCRGLVTAYAMGWLRERCEMARGLTADSGCGIGYEAHEVVPRFRALRWR